MRNKYKDHGEDSRGEVDCDCCGGTFDKHQDATRTYRAMGIDAPSLIVCEQCSEELDNDGPPIGIVGQTWLNVWEDDVELNAEQFGSLENWVKYQKVLAFLPASQQIMDADDVREFCDALTAFLVWHPDTDFNDYEYQEGPKKGAKIFSPPDAAGLNAAVERCNKVLKKVKSKTPADMYDAGCQSLQRAGRMATLAKNITAILIGWGFNAQSSFVYTDERECEVISLIAGENLWHWENVPGKGWRGEYRLAHNKLDKTVVVGSEMETDPIAVAHNIVMGIVGDTMGSQQIEEQGLDEVHPPSEVGRALDKATENMRNKGQEIATALNLKIDREYADRFVTDWGTKTALGLFLTLKKEILSVNG